MKTSLNQNRISFTQDFYPFIRIVLAICCSHFIMASVQGQNIHIKGLVINQFTKEKIAFASIYWQKTGAGSITDTSGHFTISGPVSTEDSLVISYVGFQNVSISSSVLKVGSSELVIEMSQRKQTEELIVVAKYNKGLFWWRKILQHKRINNPSKFNNYSCEKYQKLELDLSNVSRDGFNKVKLLKPFEFVLNNIDSTSDKQPFLPVYMTERISRYFYSATPHKTREEVQAVQTNGIQNESITHLIDGVGQKINAYENYITLYGKEFISPLNDAGAHYYNYKGADTQYISGQRYLHLYFSPKREGENTFSGDCWIHSGTWAIKKITLDISSTANINYVKRLSLMQEFIQQNDTTWVFSKDKMTAEISPLNKNKISLIARQTNLYRNVLLNHLSTLQMLGSNTEKDQLIISDSAKKHSALYWQQQRPEKLSVNEQKVYQMIDTIKTMPLFKKYTNTLEFIVDGRKNLGLIEIGPWYKWISANQLEKCRIRFDIATTEKFSSTLKIHSYLAYGFGDSKLKGKLDLGYKIPNQKNIFLQASYLHDLNNGRSRNNDDEMSIDNMFSQLIRKPSVKQKFIQVDEFKTAISKEWSNHLSVQVSFSRTNYETFTPLPPKKMIALNEKDIINSELGIKLRFAPAEKKIVTRRKDIRMQGSNPVFEARYMLGIPQLFGSQYRYHKVTGMISQKFSIPRWGKLNYQVYGGKIINGPLPFMLLELHPGNEIYFYSKESFNLMNRFEYFSDQYGGFSIEHDFEKKLLNLLPLLRKTKMRQFWNVKAIWGDLSADNKKLNCREFGNYRMKSLQGNSYIEVGTGLDNIFNYFRVDLVWRFAPSTAKAPGIVPPAGAASMANFGVFGSFHIQF